MWSWLRQLGVAAFLAGAVAVKLVQLAITWMAFTEAWTVFTTHVYPGNAGNAPSGVHAESGSVAPTDGVSAKSVVVTARIPIGTTAKTGDKCPESGVWQIVGTPTTTAPIAKGNVMPPYADRPVTWRLARYA